MNIDWIYHIMNKYVHEVINSLYYVHQTEKQKYVYVHAD